jgi:ATPase subunit of ABC transporter with duplicated ATPase domains
LRRCCSRSQISCCSTSRRTISISRRRCGYPGDYDSFARQRREREAQTEAARAAQEAKAKKLQAYVDRWRYKAHTARQAQSRLRALAKLQPIAAVSDDASMVFDFPSPKELRPPLIVLEDAEAGYAANAPVLSRLDLRIDPDDRIALAGRNGNGKTMLARLLAGQLKPMGGSLTASGNCASAISLSIRSRTRRRCSTWSTCCQRRSQGRYERSSAASDFPVTR